MPFRSVIVLTAALDDVSMDPARKAQIAARLHEAWVNSPLTQEELADRVGVKMRALQFWLAGTKGVNRGNVERVCKALGVDPDSIWFGPPAESDSARLARVEAKLDTLLRFAGGDPEAFASAVEEGADSARDASEQAPRLRRWPSKDEQ